MKIESNTRFPWISDRDTVENSRLTAFMRFAGAEDYDALARRAAAGISGSTIHGDKVGR